MDSKTHLMASMEEGNIDGQNENKKSRLLQAEHESVEVKYMVMASDALLARFRDLLTENYASKQNTACFLSIRVVSSGSGQL